MDSPKPPRIRFCINNPRNLAERYQLIELGIPSKDCLGNCSACFMGRFLEIDSKYVPCENYKDILHDFPKDSTDKRNPDKGQRKAR